MCSIPFCNFRSRTGVRQRSTSRRQVRSEECHHRVDRSVHPLGVRSLRHDHHADERSQEQARELPRGGGRGDLSDRWLQLLCGAVVRGLPCVVRPESCWPGGRTPPIACPRCPYWRALPRTTSTPVAASARRWRLPDLLEWRLISPASACPRPTRHATPVPGSSAPVFRRPYPAVEDPRRRGKQCEDGWPASTARRRRGPRVGTRAAAQAARGITDSRPNESQPEAPRYAWPAAAPPSPPAACGPIRPAARVWTRSRSLCASWLASAWSTRSSCGSIRACSLSIGRSGSSSGRSGGARSLGHSEVSSVL